MEEQSSEIKLLQLMNSAYSSIIVVMGLSDNLDRSSTLTLRDFYFQIAKTHLPGKEQDPFNPGVILMSSYLSLVLGKEKWNQLLPNGNARSSPKEWIIRNCDFNDSDEPNPTLKHVIKRMRNGFSHGRVECDVPEEPNSMSRADLLKQTIFTIKDKKGNSSFWIKISAQDLWNLNMQFFNDIGLYEVSRFKK